MKKLCAVFCVAVAAAFSVPSVHAAEKPVVLTFWSLFTGGDGEFFNAMIAEFNRTHKDIQLKSDPAKYTDYYTKLTTALASKKAPDIVVVHRDSMLPFVKSGTLYALDDVMKKINAPMNDFVPAPLNACRFNGKLYSIPLDVHPIIMYYNKDLLAKAGIAKVPESYDELVRAAKTVQEKTGAVGLGVDNTTATYKAYTLARIFVSGMGQKGGSVLTADCKKAAFNNKDGAEVVQGLIDSVNRYGITPKGYDYDSAMTDFRLGKTAFYINGVWATGALEKQAGLNFAAVPFPALMGKAGAWAGSHTLAIPVQRKTDPKKVEAAAKFIIWMTQHGEMWAKAGHIPTMLSVREKREFKVLPYRAGYVAAAESVIAAPNTGAWQEIYDNLSDMLEAAVAQNQNGVQAVAGMEKKVNEILASY